MTNRTFDSAGRSSCTPSTQGAASVLPAAARGAFRFLLRCVDARVTPRGCVKVAGATKLVVDDIATRLHVVRFAIELIDVGVGASRNDADVSSVRSALNEYEMLFLHAKKT